MKKKLIVTLALALCVLICAFSFAGCSKPSGTEEYNAFKQKVVNVLKDNGIDVVEKQADETVGTIVSPTAFYVSTNIADQMKELILGDNEVVSAVGIVDQVRQEMYEQALLIPLIVGDGMVNNHNADTIYNTSVFIDSWWECYMEFKASGTVTTINTYTPAYGGDSEYSAGVYLDYKSKDNYNFVMLLVWGNGKMGYRYGNSQKQFVYLDYDPQDVDNSQIFFSSKAGEGYISIDTQVLNGCFELVENQFDGMKVEDFNYLTEPTYTFNTQEWTALCAKYFPSEE